MMADDRGRAGTERLVADSPAGEAETRFLLPPVRGRHVYLRPLLPGDYAFVSAAELSGELARRWRFRGATVSPERWAQATWEAALAQFLVFGATSQRPLGLVVVYRPSFQDGHACLAAETFQVQSRGPLMILGIALFLDYVFTCWNFHKLYLEVPEYNLPAIASGLGNILVLEGRLQKHWWYGGRQWDQLILALYRDRWVDAAPRFLSAEREPRGQSVRVNLATRDGE